MRRIIKYKNVRKFKMDDAINGGADYHSSSKETGLRIEHQLPESDDVIFQKIASFQEWLIERGVEDLGFVALKYAEGAGLGLYAKRTARLDETIVKVCVFRHNYTENHIRTRV